MSDDVQSWLSHLASDVQEEHEAAYAWLHGHGGEITPALVAALREDRVGAAYLWRVLLLLREIADRSTLPEIVSMLRHPHHLVRSGAREALAVIPGAEATDALIGALADPDLDAVRHAVSLLGDRGDARAAEPLLSLLQHGDAALRQMAVRALRALDGAGVAERLQAHLADETDAEVRAAIEARP